MKVFILPLLILFFVTGKNAVAVQSKNQLLADTLMSNFKAEKNTCNYDTCLEKLTQIKEAYETLTNGDQVSAEGLLVHQFLTQRRLEEFSNPAKEALKVLFPNWSFLYTKLELNKSLIYNCDSSVIRIYEIKENSTQDERLNRYEIKADFGLLIENLEEKIIDDKVTEYYSEFSSNLEARITFKSESFIELLITSDSDIYTTCERVE